MCKFLEFFTPNFSTFEMYHGKLGHKNMDYAKQCGKRDKSGKKVENKSEKNLKMKSVYDKCINMHKHVSKCKQIYTPRVFAFLLHCFFNTLFTNFLHYVLVNFTLLFTFHSSNCISEYETYEHVQSL
jgi:hypothetical protein